MPRPEVFLSHSSADKESVRTIALQLQQRSIPIWLDEWNLIPGEPWVDALGQALQECSACIVFLGPGGDAPWHHEEVRSALNHAIRDRSYRVIPVLLPGARQERLSHLPEFLGNRQWVEFSRLDDPNAIHRLVCGIQGVEPGPAMGGSHTPRSNPYRGLRFFEVGDAPLFFGREVLTQELLAKLARESRFVSIVGPSGSGKSSLARAGLLASLGAGGLPGSAEWPQVIIRPGAFPLESLAVGLASKLVAGIDPSELIRRLEAGEEALHREVRTALQGRLEPRVVLLVDQAEEAFTQGMRDADRAAFFANLVYAATVRAGQLVVVLAFRADFVPRFAEYRQLAALVSENLLLVPPMSEYELRRAIVSPAERSGRPLRPTLVDELLSDVSGRPGSLPLLEHALEQLWERPELVLGIEEYRSIGGVSGALNSRAEEVFGKLTPSHQATCRRLFLRLIQHGSDALDTRRRVRGTELPADQREVIQAFAAEGVHLLTWSREGEHEFLEVAHEELLRSWGRLQRWATDDRSGQRVHRRLTASTAEWSARAPLDRDESFLYRGAALKEVEEWLARLPGEDRQNILNRDEAAFLEQSQIARDRSRAVRDRLAQDARRTANSPTRVVLAHAQLAEMEGAVRAEPEKVTRTGVAVPSEPPKGTVRPALEPGPAVPQRDVEALSRAEPRTEASHPMGGAATRALVQRRTRLLVALAGVALVVVGGIVGRILVPPPKVVPIEVPALRDKVQLLLRRDDGQSRERALAELSSMVSSYPEYIPAQADLVVALALQLDDERIQIRRLSAEADELNRRIARLNEEKSPIDWQARVAVMQARMNEIDGMVSLLDEKSTFIDTRLNDRFLSLQSAQPNGIDDQRMLMRAQAVYSGVKGSNTAIALAERYKNMGGTDGWAAVALAELALNARVSPDAMNAAHAEMDKLATQDSTFLRSYVLSARLSLAQRRGEIAVSELEAVLALNPAHEVARQLLESARTTER